MKHLLFIYSILFFAIAPGAKGYSPDVDRDSFYAAMRSDDLNAVNEQLDLLAKDSSKESKAFEGAMLMKKAGLVKGPFKKLKIFKKGHSLLEAALKLDSTNPEFRFLRLMIQENARKIVGYKSDLQTDSQIIQTDFSKMTPELQQVIREYSKSSKVLAPAKLGA